ncbi:MAG: hypothetical protein ACRD2W_05330 [Acidimicrobiales bacterium]
MARGGQWHVDVAHHGELPPIPLGALTGTASLTVLFIAIGLLR